MIQILRKKQMGKRTDKRVKSDLFKILGVDKDGEIYIVETKLYKNSDKRLVVAQILDYGASLWHFYNDYDTFLREIDRHVNIEKIFVRFSRKLKKFSKKAN